MGKPATSPGPGWSGRVWYLPGWESTPNSVSDDLNNELSAYGAPPRTLQHFHHLPTHSPTSHRAQSQPASPPHLRVGPRSASTTKGLLLAPAHILRRCGRMQPSQMPHQG